MILKVIYFTCCDKTTLHQKFIDNVESMIEKYKDYRIELYDHKDIDEYFKEHINGDYYRKINKQYGAVLSDYFRFNILYDRGGIYLDIKSYLRSMDFLEEGIDAYSFYWKRHDELLSGFLVSKKGSPIIKRVIEQGNANIENYKGHKSALNGVLGIISPKVYTKCSLDLMKENSIKFNTFNIDGFTVKVIPDYKKYIVIKKIHNYKKYYKLPHYCSLGRTPIVFN